MTDPRLQRVADIFADFVDRGRTELLLRQLAVDVVWRTGASAGPALHGRFIGHEGVREYLRRFHDLFAVEAAVVTDRLLGTDKITVLGTQRLRLRATDETQELQWAMILGFIGDDIVDVLVIEDLAPLLARAPLRPAQ